MKWRPIATAPKDGSRIMLYSPSGHSIVIDRLVNGKDEWWEQVSTTRKELVSEPVVLMVTTDEKCWAEYWLPLPELPEDQQ